MERHYKHLDAEVRGVIFAEHQRGSSLREIGHLLGLTGPKLHIWA
jgi:IS30 family transposase